MSLIFTGKDKRKEIYKFGIVLVTSVYTEHFHRRLPAL